MSAAFENAFAAYMNACRALALLVTPETLAEYAHRWRVLREASLREFGAEVAFDFLQGLVKARCDRATLQAVSAARLAIEQSVRHEAFRSAAAAGAGRRKSGDGADAIPAR